VNEPMERAALDQPALASASRTALLISAPRRLWAVAAIGLTAPPEFPADSARRAAQKPPDRPLAAPSTMLGEYHATFLATQFMVFPWFGLHPSLGENLCIGVVFAGISLLRSYALRLLFDAIRY